MNIDYNLYRIFLYLFEEKSISKTANKLYVSQPAISYSLKELESQLGYTLFIRNSKGIEPTNEAKELYRYVSTAFNILKDGEEYIQNLNDLNIGLVKFGISSDISSIHFVNLIAKFRNIYPGIKFEILTGSSTELLNKLSTKEIDVFIDVLPISVESDICKEALTVFDNCFAYSENIIGKIAITDISELKDYNLILPTKKSNLRIKLDEYLNNKSVVLDSVIEVSNTDTMLEMIKNGLGIGYISEELIREDSSIKILKLHDLPKTDICLIYKEEYLKMATKKFIEFLINNK